MSDFIRNYTVVLPYVISHTDNSSFTGSTIFYRNTLPHRYNSILTGTAHGKIISGTDHSRVKLFEIITPACIILIEFRDLRFFIEVFV
jgi:hypothetical protein